jgi:hypothetical protein
LRYGEDVDRRFSVKALTLAVVAAALAACGTTIQLPQAPGATPPWTANPLPPGAITQTGDAPATVDKSNVNFMLDNAGSLVVHLSLTSTATTAQTFALQATFLDQPGTVVGNASGGQIMVGPGATTPVQLNGQTPHGTIASATIEVTAVAAP